MTTESGRVVLGSVALKARTLAPGGVSPRAAARMSKGRAKVAAWLKTLENRAEGAGGPDVTMASYDFTWMWRELDVLPLRK